MISQILLPAGLAFIMFAIGLTLQFADFVRVFTRPRAIVFGLFCQVLLLPIAAFAVLRFWNIEPMLAIGVMILAASPGGITSNLLTRMVEGDTALSISMTSITSLLSMFSVPLIVAFSFDWFLDIAAPGQMPVWRMTLGIFAVSTLPVLVGMSVNQLSRSLAVKIETIARPLSVLAFIAIVFGAFYSQWTSMMAYFPIIALPLLILNVLIMAIGYFGAELLGTGKASARAIALEGGLQNGALGIFVAATLIGNPVLAVPSMIYALIMNATVLGFIVFRQFVFPARIAD